MHVMELVRQPALPSSTCTGKHQRAWLCWAQPPGMYGNGKGENVLRNIADALASCFIFGFGELERLFLNSIVQFVLKSSVTDGSWLFLIISSNTGDLAVMQDVLSLFPGEQHSPWWEMLFIVHCIPATKTYNITTKEIARWCCGIYWKCFPGVNNCCFFASGKVFLIYSRWILGLSCTFILQRASWPSIIY